MLNMMPYTRRSLTNRNLNRDLYTPFGDAFFRSFFGDDMVTSFRTDVKETKEGYELSAELPGVKKENLHIAIDEGVMTISANAEEEKSEDKPNYVYRERRVGSMSRSFNLEGIDEGGITAEYNDGVLCVKLPRKAEPEPEAGRTIQIN